jgi:hypothetical protein
LLKSLHEFISHGKLSYSVLDIVRITPDTVGCYKCQDGCTQACRHVVDPGGGCTTPCSQVAQKQH